MERIGGTPKLVHVTQRHLRDLNALETAHGFPAVYCGLNWIWLARGRRVREATATHDGDKARQLQNGGHNTTSCMSSPPHTFARRRVRGVIGRPAQHNSSDVRGRLGNPDLVPVAAVRR